MGDSTLVSGATRGFDGAEARPGSAGLPDTSADVAAPVRTSPPAPEELDRSLRAEFTMAVMRFRRGRTSGAVADFQRLVGVTTGIVPAHKHMFTDFGKDLRKCKLFELALTSFSRALELSPGDSHACFNLARICYEMGHYDEAGEYLKQSLQLEPGLKCARKLLERTRTRTGSRAS